LREKARWRLADVIDVIEPAITGGPEQPPITSDEISF
jgi:hypothetical protein